jgi:hypothetical protein
MVGTFARKPPWRQTHHDKNNTQGIACGHQGSVSESESFRKDGNARRVLQGYRLPSPVRDPHLAGEASLPVTGLDSDSGGEFVNWHMVRYCEKEKLFFTRSRPNHKNDNAYVEQKNYTHIRKWMGYRRYDTKAQRDTMNDLYRKELCLFNNFFRPVMKILKKEKVNNAVCKKTYGEALTPYERMMRSQQVPSESKARLRKLYESLNPVKLKEAIAAKLKRIQKS